MNYRWTSMPGTSSWLLLPATATSKCTAVPDKRHSTYSGCSLRCNLGYRRIDRNHRPSANGAQRRRRSGYWCRQVYHIIPVLCDVLMAACTSMNTVQTSKVALTASDCVRGSDLSYFRDVWSKTGLLEVQFQWPTSLAGQISIWLNVEIWLCHGPELGSVVGAFTSQQQSSEMPFLSTTTQDPSVEYNSEQSWKPISSKKRERSVRSR